MCCVRGLAYTEHLDTAFLIHIPRSVKNIPQVGDYSISLKAPVTIKHFKVQCIDSQYAIGQRRYNSMEELIRHYTHKSPIFTSQDNAERLYLVKPFDNPASRPSPAGQNNNGNKGYMKVWD